ncbi:hypothetical protein GCM10018954_036170 [Kutzneria kofuensis]
METVCGSQTGMQCCFAADEASECGLVAEAADYFQRLHDTAIHRLGPDHPDTLTTRNNIAS